jgi:predicted house-cleaning noncanonical NTP pyrophosphatase (MazG superfamily)
VAAVLVAVKGPGKLVRDRIPQIIDGLGKSAVWRRLGDDEFKSALRAKMLEEAEELAASADDALLWELADLEEVIEAILSAYNLTREDLEAARQRKNEERGAFARRILLESIRE